MGSDVGHLYRNGHTRPKGKDGVASKSTECGGREANDHRDVDGGPQP